MVGKSSSCLSKETLLQLWSAPLCLVSLILDPHLKEFPQLESISDSSFAEEDLAAQRSSKVLSSYALDLKSVIHTNNVDNIIDVQFLHGYNQPTLAILYEPLQTFAGRIAVRRDTCRIDVITLDVKERVSAFIWSREGLPFDCVKILPVPKPLGGILVFCVNNLFFLNQGIPPYAVSVNSLGDGAMEGIASK